MPCTRYSREGRRTPVATASTPSLGKRASDRPICGGARDGEIKATMSLWSAGVVSACLHIVLDGTAAAPHESVGCRSNRESIQNQRSERHHSQRSVLLRMLGGVSGHDRMGGRCRTNGAPSKARAARDRLRRLAALTALRWPGSFACMRSWPALRDCAQAAEEVRGRSAAA